MSSFELVGIDASPWPSRQAITDLHRAPEAQTVARLIEEARLPANASIAAAELARILAVGVRSARGRSGGVDALMHEFALDSREGVALMCLAEALLRIPDAATRDRLIRDKIGQGDWRAHVGRSPSLFVNAAAWGLLVTGKLVDTRAESALEQAVASLLRKGGEPLVRKGVDIAMRLLGRQFVTGRTIDEALANAQEREARGYRFSFDMLGEGAVTGADAAAYLGAYETAIHAIGRHAAGRGVIAGPGISVKLSALHPRYTRSQRARVLEELGPRIAGLARLARHYDIALNIDAEEADRLELSLDLLERLARDPDLAGWDGIGFVVQAYQKRARPLIDWLVALAVETSHRFMVRLVKGAYWDTEIKRAQVDGMPDYPVFTRKAHTDVSYLACARAMLAAPTAIYPQFATHNAQTLAAIRTIAADAEYEFQCLHGMGETLYDQIVGNPQWDRACRIYAPVGAHETLLAYLVRRLLENGANSSFVNRIVDPAVSIDELVADPLLATEADRGRPHPRVPLPAAILPGRRNSRGIDLSADAELRALQSTLSAVAPQFSTTVSTQMTAIAAGTQSAVTNPSDPADIVGTVRAATRGEVDAAIAVAAGEGMAWSRVAADTRAHCLERAADLLESERATLIALAVREAGKTVANAQGEVREAADFCRYYAAQARRELSGGDTSAIGPVVCIAPWNFPIAIFTGEISAALAAGNPVLAKPAEQTPLAAAQVVRLFHQAGIPGAALQLLPGEGEIVGAALVADPRIHGVVFTGSTAVARQIHRQLAGRDDDPVLIAETGGQNAMIVDSSALPEQVVGDALQSAFDSAGQRCSALRVLCIQDEIAPRVLEMLEGGLDELVVGDPRKLQTDVGPVIDAESRARLLAHIGQMRAAGMRVVQQPLPAECARGTFVPPTLIELDRFDRLTHEVFGPVLHVLRFDRAELPALIDAINASGYGLTHGIQSRIDETVDAIVRRVHAGNIYVNRNIIGAVVGVQPFGGTGLSGTGPKAGGPLYLRRLVRGPVNAASPVHVAPGEPVRLRMAELIGGAASLSRTERARLTALLTEQSGDPDGTAISVAAAERTASTGMSLPGPTGEANRWRLQPRGLVGCIAESEADLLEQMIAVLRTGNRAVMQHSPFALRIRDAVGADLCSVVDDILAAAPDALLLAGTLEELRRWRQAAAETPGKIVPTIVRRPEGGYDSERLVVECVVTINTTASGGNAELLAVTG